MLLSCPNEFERRKEQIQSVAFQGVAAGNEQNDAARFDLGRRTETVQLAPTVAAATH